MNIKKTKNLALLVNFPLELIHDIHREPFWRPLVQIICLETVGKTQAHVFRCLLKDLEDTIKKFKAEGIKPPLIEATN